MSQLAIQNTPEVSRHAAMADDPSVFADIYQETVNIAVWQRDLSQELAQATTEFLAKKSTTSAVLAVTPQNAIDVLKADYDTKHIGAALSQDIAQLVDMFCYLFNQKRAGIRLTVLDRAMCPRFHVDKIPCRLVTTYQGVATQWLEHNNIDRTKLGAGSQGKLDEQSGLLKHANQINQLTVGDVALLKGENWDESEGYGLVHRSPPVPADENRLLLTIDFIDD